MLTESEVQRFFLIIPRLAVSMLTLIMALSFAVYAEILCPF